MKGHYRERKPNVKRSMVKETLEHSTSSKMKPDEAFPISLPFIPSRMHTASRFWVPDSLPGTVTIYLLFGSW